MLDAALEAGEDVAHLRSLLVVRHGKLVAERYYHGGRADIAENIRSASKSVVSTTVGLAIQDGALPSVDATMASLVPAGYVPGSVVARSMSYSSSRPATRGNSR